MKKFAVVLLFIAVIVSCSKKDMEQKGPYLAKAGDTKITQSDYDREFQTLPEYAQKMFEGEGGKERFLEEIIKKELLYQEALKKGIDKTPEFKKKMEEFKKINLISELFEKDIMSKAKISDQEVRNFYEEHKGEFTTTSQIKASHILVKTVDEANKVLERLKKGEKFGDVAKAVSIDKSSAANGGDIGYFSRGQMVPEFEQAASGLKKGEISNPVKTAFGYHIIKVTDRKEGPVVEFDKIKDMIMQKLSADKQKEAFDNYMVELKKKYTVEINKQALSTPSKTGEEKDKPGTPGKEQEQPGEETKKNTK
ncbi:MAG: peptidylprolyl isomerase [Nitrospirota bacterium]